MGKFRTIFFANLSETALSLAHLMSEKNRKMEIDEDHALCERFIFSKGDDRVLITPLPVNPVMKAHVSEIMGFNNILNLSPSNIGESLSESVLKDRNLLRKLEKIIGDNPGIDIVAYVSSEEFMRVVTYLKSRKLKFVTSEIPEPENNWTVAFFDSKAGFRQLTTFMDNGFPKMPKGIVCDSIEEIIGSVRYFFNNGMNCVMKANRGLAGAGLRIMKRRDFAKKNLRQELEKIFKENPFWSGDIVVVEEYIDPNFLIGGGAPNIELKVSKDRVRSLYCCSMRVNDQGVFQGIEIGKGTYSKYMEKKLIRHGITFGKLLKKFSYNGHFEIDFVAGKDNRLYPIESNVRRTGGTHIYDAAKRLLGKNFEKDYYLTSMDFQDAPKLKGRSYGQMKELVRDLLYPLNGKKEGVVVTIFNHLYVKWGKIGYFVVSSDKKSAYAIENAFIKRVS